MTTVEVDEVQGNVLYAYGDYFRHVRYILFYVTHSTTAKATLRGWLGRITFGSRPKGLSDTDEDDTNGTSAVPRSVTHRPHLNVAFTFSGLKALGIPDDFLYAFPDEFREGALERARGNGDVAASSPENWFPGLGTGHVLVVVYARSEEERDRLGDDLAREAHGCMKVLHDLSASRLESTRRSETHEDGAWTRRPQACDSRLDRSISGLPTDVPSPLSRA